MSLSKAEIQVVKFGKRVPELDWILKRLQAPDFDLMYYLKEYGATDRRVIKRMWGLEAEGSIRRLKAYELIKAVRKEGRVRSYVLDLTHKALILLEYEVLLLKSEVKKGETVEKSHF